MVYNIPISISRITQIKYVELILCARNFSLPEALLQFPYGPDHLRSNPRDKQQHIEVLRENLCTQYILQGLYNKTHPILALEVVSHLLPSHLPIQLPLNSCLLTMSTPFHLRK